MKEDELLAGAVSATRGAAFTVVNGAPGTQAGLLVSVPTVEETVLAVTVPTPSFIPKRPIKPVPVESSVSLDAAISVEERA